jgi:hypothetical protein
MQSVRDFSSGTAKLISLLPVVLLGYAFYILEGYAYWGLLLGYPIFVGLSLSALFMYLKGPAVGATGQAGGALFVAFIFFLFLIGAEIFAIFGAWLFHKLV